MYPLLSCLRDGSRKAQSRPRIVVLLRSQGSRHSEEFRVRSFALGVHFLTDKPAEIQGFHLRHSLATPLSVDAAGLQAPAEFLEESADLCGVEFSAGHAVARLRSRMKTFMAASSGGVSDMVSCFIGSRILR